jgi:hypothetical protein
LQVSRIAIKTSIIKTLSLKKHNDQVSIIST